MKATEQYFPVVLFIMLYKVALTVESVDEILNCDHSNESYWAELSCGAVYYAVQGGSNFSDCWLNAKLRPFKWKPPSSTILWYCVFLSILRNKFAIFLDFSIVFILGSERINLSENVLFLSLSLLNFSVIVKNP